eukprot:PLAT10622.1.p1 GENE.PLAT10622.1~~PLAT10622.1.p1  ORF type:complete len:1246 (+),score=414.40 PLAT10622.1:45-3782(+)
MEDFAARPPLQRTASVLQVWDSRSGSFWGRARDTSRRSSRPASGGRRPLRRPASSPPHRGHEAIEAQTARSAASALSHLGFGQRHPSKLSEDKPVAATKKRRTASSRPATALPRRRRAPLDGVLSTPAPQRPRTAAGARRRAPPSARRARPVSASTIPASAAVVEELPVGAGDSSILPPSLVGAAAPEEEVPVWRKPKFPSAMPSSREEVRLLDEWMANSVAQHMEAARTSMPDANSYLLGLQRIYDSAMDELIRQVSAHCAERGELLRRVWQSQQMLEQAARKQALQTMMEGMSDTAAVASAASQPAALVVSKAPSSSSSSLRTAMTKLEEEMDSFREAAKSSEAQIALLNKLVAESDRQLQARMERESHIELEVNRLKIMLGLAERKSAGFAAHCAKLEEEAAVKQEADSVSVSRRRVLEDFAKLCAIFTNQAFSKLLTKDMLVTRDWLDEEGSRLSGEQARVDAELAYVLSQVEETDAWVRSWNDQIAAWVSACRKELSEVERHMTHSSATRASHSKLNHRRRMARVRRRRKDIAQALAALEERSTAWGQLSTTVCSKQHAERSKQLGLLRRAQHTIRRGGRMPEMLQASSLRLRGEQARLTAEGRRLDSRHTLQSEQLVQLAYDVRQLRQDGLELAADTGEGKHIEEEEEEEEEHGDGKVGEHGGKGDEAAAAATEDVVKPVLSRAARLADEQEELNQQLMFLDRLRARIVSYFSCVHEPLQQSTAEVRTASKQVATQMGKLSELQASARLASEALDVQGVLDGILLGTINKDAQLMPLQGFMTRATALLQRQLFAPVRSVEVQTDDVAIRGQRSEDFDRLQQLLASGALLLESEQATATRSAGKLAVRPADASAELGSAHASASVGTSTSHVADSGSQAWKLARVHQEIARLYEAKLALARPLPVGVSWRDFVRNSLVEDTDSLTGASRHAAQLAAAVRLYSVTDLRCRVFARITNLSAKRGRAGMSDSGGSGGDSSGSPPYQLVLRTLHMLFPTARACGAALAAGNSRPICLRLLTAAVIAGELLALPPRSMELVTLLQRLQLTAVPVGSTDTSSMRRTSILALRRTASGGSDALPDGSDLRMQPAALVGFAARVEAASAIMPRSNELLITLDVLLERLLDAHARLASRAVDAGSRALLRAHEAAAHWRSRVATRRKLWSTQLLRLFDSPADGVTFSQFSAIVRRMDSFIRRCDICDMYTACVKRAGEEQQLTGFAVSKLLLHWFYKSHTSEVWHRKDV